MREEIREEGERPRQVVVPDAEIKVLAREG
jgi:hypothetical protein